MTDAGRLLAVKLIHTVIWVIVGGAIVALHAAVVTDRADWFGGLHVVIGAEIVVLIAYRWTCPLTHVARRYTEEDAPNFDIFLPRWLARWNKEIFTVILVGAWIHAGLRWLP